MLDFFDIAIEQKTSGIVIYPNFKVGKTKDLMIRGGSFYAVWDEKNNIWSKDEFLIAEVVDEALRMEAKKYEGLPVKVKYMKLFDSASWEKWRRYARSSPDNHYDLDSKIHFLGEKLKREDHASKTLPYEPKEMTIPAYEELSTTLYDPEELQKIEWAVGSILAGDSINIQKFIVMYGDPGSGKSTILRIVEKIFEGYVATFDSKALSSSSNQFSLESFKDNPMVAIQHDGDFSRIEDNTKINTIVSHEDIMVNEKYKSAYSMQIRSFLFLGTNTPVKVTNAKSGVLRRLIDVYPSGRHIEYNRYVDLVDHINFEIPGIAWHCLQVYKSLGIDYYNGYRPEKMIDSTNEFYNFICENMDFFIANDPMPLNVAWLRYKDYVMDSGMKYAYAKMAFKEELKNYYEGYHTRYSGKSNMFIGFIKDKYLLKKPKNERPKKQPDWLNMIEQASTFDLLCASCPAQYAKEDGTPNVAWDNVKTKLRNIKTNQLHYVKVPENHIVIDFDLKDENGEKSLEKNLDAASKFPETYAEVSKSGSGVHLHYIYDGDVARLSRIYDKDIEIKVFTGKSSLRRKLTVCNNLRIDTIRSGLPLKEVKKVIEDQVIQSEKGLRRMIEKNLRKEIHADTRSSMDFIYKILEDGYKSGMKYDVTDMRPDIQTFALNSTHQSDYCLRLIDKMHFASDEPSPNFPFAENMDDDGPPIVFFDVEVFPNCFIVCWKKKGEGKSIIQMINPKPEEVEALFKFRLIGFNNRDYDNHMIYAAAMGYPPEELFKLSQRIIVEKDKFAKFGQAYNLSYTDVYDFLSAGNKMSLKKWEIQLGIKHNELDHPWDKPLPEEKWQIAADYCSDDVFATEAVFDANQADWEAREILAEISGLSVNDTTNTHTTKIIVGDDPHPQTKFIYTDLSTIFPGYEYNPYGIDPSRYNEGAKIVRGKSIYKGLDPGEGGYALGNPGVYIDVALLDIASMHPHSAIKLKIFGEEYTARFEELVLIRLLIKHKQYDEAKKLFGGKLAKYLDDPKKAKKLSNALKTAINSVYGLTSASFENKLRDPRNIDNIVAKYGALFMIDLKEEVEQRGFTVVHIKTDSIKIANATPEIIQFVMDYGKEYGYTFEHEATYSKMCIVNDAVYIAKYTKAEIDPDTGKEIWWTATGTQFQVPYVFKTLFSKEEVTFRDLCETKSVTTAMYLDFNEKLTEGEHDYRFVGKVGLFTPILEGYGGAELLRQNRDKFSAVTGTKKKGVKNGVYRWMESDMVERLGLTDKVDMSYYNTLIDEAIETISKYGDFEWFVSDDNKVAPEYMEPVKPVSADEVPFAA